MKNRIAHNFHFVFLIIAVICFIIIYSIDWLRIYELPIFHENINEYVGVYLFTPMMHSIYIAIIISFIYAIFLFKRKFNFIYGFITSIILMLLARLIFYLYHIIPYYIIGHRKFALIDYVWEIYVWEMRFLLGVLIGAICGFCLGYLFAKLIYKEKKIAKMD